MKAGLRNLGVVAGGLARGGAVVVPHGKLVDGGGHLVEHAGLGAIVVTTAATATDPDVLGLDLAVGVGLEVNSAGTSGLAHGKVAERGRGSGAASHGGATDGGRRHEGIGARQGGRNSHSEPSPLPVRA